MLYKIFRLNSCIHPEKSQVYVAKSNSVSSPCFPLEFHYNEDRYDFIYSNDIFNSNPRVFVAVDKHRKKNVVIKKSRNIQNEINSLNFSDCNFIEKIVEYDFIQKVIIYNFNYKRDLAEYIQHNPITIEKITKTVLKPILIALEFIHNKGFAHRDVKPENILYGDGGCKLTDFEFCEKIPQCGYFSKWNGTFEFMAPEVVERKGCLESDIWSLGIVYYECLHKKLPYFNMKYDATNYEKIFSQIRETRIMIDMNLDLSIITILKILLSRNVLDRQNCYEKIYSLINTIAY